MQTVEGKYNNIEEARKAFEKIQQLKQGWKSIYANSELGLPLSNIGKETLIYSNLNIPATLTYQLYIDLSENEEFKITCNVSTVDPEREIGMCRSLEKRLGLPHIPREACTHEGLVRHLYASEYDFAITNYSIRWLHEMSEAKRDENYPSLTDVEILEKLVEHFKDRCVSKDGGQYTIGFLTCCEVIDRTGKQAKFLSMV